MTVPRLHPLLRSHRVRTPSACGPGLLGHPVSNRGSTAEISGFSQVPGRTPLCTCPGLIPRGTPDARPIQRRGDSLPLVPRRRLPDLSLSRLVTTACTLAVYASQLGLPQRHHARLASGGWPPLPGRIGTYRVHYEGFPVLSTACSFLPSQAWPGAKHLSRGAPIPTALLHFRFSVYPQRG